MLSAMRDDALDTRRSEQAEQAASRLRIELIDGRHAFDIITPAWEALAHAAATPNIFYEPWIASPARALPEARGLRLLLAWSDRPGAAPLLAGLLPLQTPAKRPGPAWLAVQNWEQRTRALGEPLILPGRETAFWEAVLDHLDTGCGFGRYLRLSGLIADSPSTLALRALLGARRRACRTTRTVERALLRGGLSAAAYREAHIRKKVLKEHRRLRNRLADRGEVTIDRLAPDRDAGPWIDALFRLEASGWKGREGVAAAADPQAEQCYRAMLTEAHNRGRLDFQRLAMGGEPISMLATIEAGQGHGFAFKTAYDEAFASFSPGVLLEMAYLDHALDVRGLVHVDSCARAGHPMIDRIWADRLTIVSLAIPFDGWSSRLVCASLALARRVRSQRLLKVPTLRRRKAG